MEEDIEQISKDFLADAREDYVGLWSVVRRVKELTGETDPKRIRDTTMNLLSDLLKRNLLRAGMPDSNGKFVQWEESPSRIIEKIEREWSELGREPNIGEVVWFTTTE